MTESRKFSARAHGACNPAWFFGRSEICSDAFGQSRCQNVHVVGFVSNIVFGKINRSSVEGVRFDYIATDFEKPCMPFFYSVGPGNQQVFVTPFKAKSTKIIQSQILHLKISTHRAIKDH